MKSEKDKTKIEQRIRFIQEVMSTFDAFKKGFYSKVQLVGSKKENYSTIQ